MKLNNVTSQTKNHMSGGERLRKASQNLLPVTLDQDASIDHNCHMSSKGGS